MNNVLRTPKINPIIGKNFLEMRRMCRKDEGMNLEKGKWSK